MPTLYQEPTGTPCLPLTWQTCLEPADRAYLGQSGSVGKYEERAAWDRAFGDEGISNVT